MSDTVTVTTSEDKLTLHIDDWLVELSQLLKDTRLVINRDTQSLEEITCSFDIRQGFDLDTLEIESFVEGYPESISSTEIPVKEFAGLLNKAMVQGDFLFNLPELQTFLNNMLSEMLKSRTGKGLYLVSEVLNRSNILIFRNDTLAAIAGEQAKAKSPLMVSGTYNDGHSEPEHSIFLNYHIQEKTLLFGDNLYSALTGKKEDDSDAAQDSPEAASDDSYKLVFFLAGGEEVIVMEASLAGTRLKLKSVRVEDDFMFMKSSVAENYNDLSAITNLYADGVKLTRDNSWLDFLD